MDKSNQERSTEDLGSQRAGAPQPVADDGTPKFGRLLIVLLVAVMFCGLLTWVMAEFFPDFPS